MVGEICGQEVNPAALSGAQALADLVELNEVDAHEVKRGFGLAHALL